jgi:hypothetical protein
MQLVNGYLLRTKRGMVIKTQSLGSVINAGHSLLTSIKTYAWAAQDWDCQNSTNKGLLFIN